MPAQYATTQPAWRFRRAAISKKQWFDSDLPIDDAEPVMAKPQAAALSPNLIAASFDALLMEPEMKPIELPGAWTMVGKGGKPVKNVKMYDDPQQPKKKRKKKKKNARPDEERNEEAEWLMHLAEEPSSSKCVAKHARLALQHEKVAQSGRDARHWKSYRAAKEVKKFVRDELIWHMLHLESADGEGADDGATAAQTPSRRPLPKAMAQRGCKADSRAAKARRRARLDARDAKCYAMDEAAADEATEKAKATALASPVGRTRPKIDGEAVLLATPSCLLTPRAAVDGSSRSSAKRKKAPTEDWQEVGYGQRGANKTTKQRQQQQQDTSPEQGGRMSSKRLSKSRKKMSGKNCSVM